MRKSAMLTQIANLRGHVARLEHERGEIRADTDIPVVLDQLYAPLYYRLTMQHEPLTADLADKLVANITVDIAGAAVINEFNGRVNVEMHLDDVNW